MRGFLMVTGIVVLASAAGYLVLQGANEAPSDNPTQASRLEPPPVARESAINTADGSRPNGLPDRVIGTNLVAVPDVEPWELERLPPRGPLSQASDEKASFKTGTRLLHRPVAIAAGLFEVGEQRIRLAGIDPLPPDTICGTPLEDAKPCGRRALTAFRAWLRGRSIECDLSEPDANGVIEATCRLAGKDAARWLVQQGWARAKAGSRYLELETAARTQERGIFSKAE